jgi:hypothetical protein
VRLSMLSMLLGLVLVVVAIRGPFILGFLAVREFLPPNAYSEMCVPSASVMSAIVVACS